jgi:uncharacterized protein (DUF305 family)
MANEITNEKPKFISNVLIPFSVYTALFVGAGFISGAVVHYPVAPLRNLIIGIIGAILFSIGSTINEALYNKKNLREEGVVKFILFSLLLSFGIGMASGGTQHFFDTPVYASILIPAGLLIGIIAFILQRNIQLSETVMTGILLFAIVIIAPVALALNMYAKTLPVGEHGGHHHGVSSASKSAMDMTGEMESHAAMITSDSDFLMEMIPHHQEAIDTSKILLERTEDEEFKLFLEGIIEGQTNEVATMKNWHREWFGKDYTSDDRYKAMMPNLAVYNQYAEAREQYLSGMIPHHASAVAMAEKIKTITKRNELVSFADTIIEAQNKEIKQMKSWSTEEHSHDEADHMGH